MKSTKVPNAMTKLGHMNPFKSVHTNYQPVLTKITTRLSLVSTWLPIVVTTFCSGFQCYSRNDSHVLTVLSDLPVIWLSTVVSYGRWIPWKSVFSPHIIHPAWCGLGCWFIVAMSALATFFFGKTPLSKCITQHMAKFSCWLIFIFISKMKFFLWVF